MDRERDYYFGLSLRQKKHRIFEYRFLFLDEHWTLIFSLTACLQRPQPLLISSLTKPGASAAGVLMHMEYLLDRGVLSTHRIWMVLSSCTLPGRLPLAAALGMRYVFLCRREQHVPVTPGCDDREGLWLGGLFTVETSMQLSSYTCSSTNSWF